MRKDDNQKKALVVGGSDGLGLEIARLLTKAGFLVFVTGRGRSIPSEESIQFIKFDVSGDTNKLPEQIDTVLTAVGTPVDVFVYSAGFTQIGTITEIIFAEMVHMINVGILAQGLFTQEILLRQHNLPALITIGSTSQSIPRVLEPFYAASKAGAAMLTWSVSLEKEKVGRGLVVEVSGMQTKMQRERGIDTSELLRPVDVAKAIITWIHSGDVRPHMLVLHHPFKVQWPAHKWMK